MIVSPGFWGVLGAFGEFWEDLGVFEGFAEVLQRFCESFARFLEFFWRFLKAFNGFFRGFFFLESLRFQKGFVRFLGVVRIFQYAVFSVFRFLLKLSLFFRGLEGFKRVFGEFSKGFWGIFGGFLGDFWGIFGGFLGDFWGIFGGFLGDF